MGALVAVAAGLLFLPQGWTDRLRVLAGPVFSPLQDVTQGWTLEMAREMREGGGGPGLADEAGRLRARVGALEDALVKAAARLGESERQVAALSQIRTGLGELPCRLVPARLVAPEVAAGRAGARLVGGSENGVRKGGAVVSCRIARGTREAIEQGEAVLTAAGLVGVVNEVGPVTSTVRLTTDPRSNLMVQVIRWREGRWQAGAEGLARGTEDGRALQVDHVDRTADVSVGDFVVTSPSPKSPLPPYLIVGRIVSVGMKPAGLCHEIRVEPRAAVGTLREVFVLSQTDGVLSKP